MNKEANKLESKLTLNSSLTFFNGHLSSLNSYRLQLNRSKGLAKYLAQPYNTIRTLYVLDSTMGVMSYSIYLLRFSSNLCLLIELICSEYDANKEKKLRALYFSLFNDCLWGLINMSQYFWLSFQRSPKAGFLGMQLETLGQMIDLLIMIIRFAQDRDEHIQRSESCSDSERARIVVEWQFKELHFWRSLLTGTTMLTIFGLFSFSVISLPLSPVLSAVMVISSLARLLLDMEKDSRIVENMRLEKIDPAEIAKQEQELRTTRCNDLGQIIIYNIYIPLGLLCVMTLSMPALCCFAALLLGSFLWHLFQSNGEDAKQLNSYQHRRIDVN